MKNLILLVALLTAAACGKTQQFTDAGDDDTGTIDATTTDGPSTGDLTVITKSRNSEPSFDQPGVEVFVVGPDLVIGDRAVTDSAGRATVSVTGGDSVTVVYPQTGSEHYITTVGAVAPGDTLTFGEPDPFDYSQTGAPMTFNWPGVANAYYYELYSSCGGYAGGYAPATSTTSTRYAYCAASTVDVVLTAYDVNFTQIGAVTQGSVPWTDNGAYTMAAIAPLATLDLSLTGLPPEIEYAYLEVSGMYGALLYGYANTSGTPTGGTISGTGTIPAGATALRGYYSVNRSGFRGQSGTRAAAGSSTFTIANPGLLPWIGDGSVNAGAREIVWIQDSEGADAADALTLRFRWQRFDGKFYEYYYWDLVLPPGTPNRVQIPPMPADLTDLLVDTDEPYLQGIMMYESDSLETWADVRAQPEWLMMRPDQVGPGVAIPDVRFSGQGGQKGFQ